MPDQDLHNQLATLEKEHKEQTRELRLLTSELFMAEERSRRAIAADLHDHIGQALAMIQFKLMELQGNAVFSGVDTNIREMKKLIDQTIAYTRNLTFELSPPILYELGLAAALNWLTKQFSEKNNLQLMFTDDRKTKPLSDDLNIALYRSVNELLINIVKHAQATAVTVSLQKKDDTVTITVEDNGRGFETDKLSSSPCDGFGLFSIKERIRYLGGTMTITSQPGKGSRVCLCVK